MSIRQGLRRRKLPLIIDTVDVTTEEDKFLPKSLYIRVKQHIYPALSYRLGFVFGDEHSINRFYISKIAGVNHLFYNNRDLTIINGDVEGIISNTLEAALSVVSVKGMRSFVTVARRGGVKAIEYLEMGTFRKRKLLIENVDLGLSGDKIISLIKTIHAETGEAGPYILFVRKGIGKDYSRKTLNSAIMAGFNGEWCGIWESISSKHGEKTYLLHLFYHGNYKKYALGSKGILLDYIGPWSIVDCSYNRLILKNTKGVIAYDLKDKEIMWEKIFGDIRYVCSSRLGISRRSLAIVTPEKVYVLAADTGTKLRELDVEGGYVCGIGENYIAVGIEDHLRIYSWGGEYLGEYSFDGIVNGVSVIGERILIGYLSSTGSPKAVLIDMSESLEIGLRDLEMFSGETKHIDIEHVTPRVRLTGTTDRKIEVIGYGSKILFKDTGARPGLHTLDLLFIIPGFLNLREKILLLIKKPESAFDRISVASKLSRDSLGFFVPITIESSIHIDSLKIIIWSDENSIYASTHEIQGLKPGTYTIPVRILWSEAGVHEVNILIMSWSMGRMYIERLRGRLYIDLDILDPVLRIMGSTAYIWSPISLGDVRLVFSGEGIERSLLTSLEKGWNSFDVEGFIPDKVSIITRGKTIVETYRRRE